MFAVLRLRWLFTLLPRTLRYLVDSRVPFYYKFLPFLFIPFFFTPVARILSLVPVLGVLDEFTILLVCLALFTYLSAKAVSRYQTKSPSENDPVGTAPLNEFEGEYIVLEQQTKPVKTKETRPSQASQIF